MRFVLEYLSFWIFPLFLGNLITVYSMNTSTTIPNTINVQPASAQFISDESAFDGIKVHDINATSIDWWYFDAVSEYDNQSVVVVFYTATDLGFFALTPGSAVSVDIFVSWDDGTYELVYVDDLPGNTGSATVNTEDDGASGTWSSTGWSFSGAPDLSEYVVSIDYPLQDIHGSLTLKSVSILIMRPLP
jgi:hypothetical protein